MKMKKWTLWAIVFALILSLTACGASSSVEDDDEDGLKVSVREDHGREEDEDPFSDGDPFGEPAKTPDLPPITLQEFVAVDTDDFAVTVTGVDPDGMWGYTVKAVAENKSADKTFMFSVDTASVDGVSSDPFWAEEVTPGNKANAEISFSSEVLTDLGLLFSDIELVFRIYDTNDWTAEHFLSEPIHVMPYGEEHVQHYVREPQAEDILLADTEQLSITVIGIEPDTYSGYTLKTCVLNKSSDITYMFAVDHASIDGLSSDPFWAREVAPGKLTFSDISFSEDILEELDLAYSDIELAFRVYDTNDFMSDPVFQDSVHIYPNGQENAVSFVRKPQAEDVVLVDDDDICLIVTGYETGAFSGFCANVFIINKTDAAVMVSVQDASVNGFMCDPFWAREVAAGKCAFGSISWSESSLESNGITAVEEIELHLTVYNSDDFYAPKYVDETFTLVP